MTIDEIKARLEAIAEAYRKRICAHTYGVAWNAAGQCWEALGARVCPLGAAALEEQPVPEIWLHTPIYALGKAWGHHEFLSGFIGGFDKDDSRILYDPEMAEGYAFGQEMAERFL